MWVGNWRRDDGTAGMWRGGFPCDGVGGWVDGGVGEGSSAFECAAFHVAGERSCADDRNLEWHRLHRWVVHLSDVARDAQVGRPSPPGGDRRGHRPTSWNPNVNGSVDVLRVIGKRIYVGGGFTSI